MTCADAARALAGRAEVRSAGKGSKGIRWYAWSWLATASRQRCLLIRRHLRSGELAYHYCFVPEGQPLTLTRLIRAAGLRWPVEEQFRAGKDSLGLDQAQVRLYTAIARHHAAWWLDWRRRHQARARWYHQRTRLARDTAIALAS
jgi:hypothetical protein